VTVPRISGKQTVAEAMNSLAAKRDRFIRRYRYYHHDLVRFLKFSIPENSHVLEVGCGTGHLIAALNPGRGVGIDISPRMIEEARRLHPEIDFRLMDAEELSLEEPFDFIILSDTLGHLEDIQRAFSRLHRVCGPETRLLITSHSFLWQPVLKAAEWLRLKMPNQRLNWLNTEDICNLLNLEDFEVIRRERRLLLPIFVPLLSWLLNRYAARLPLLNRLCLTSALVARPAPQRAMSPAPLSLSIMVPARNEAGNIEELERRVPLMAKTQEIIFVEGHSTDATREEIERVCRLGRRGMDLRWAPQEGKGKADAVRKGFAMASGDVLMILDADLSVAPEELPKFYAAIATGKGEFINGTRLVYPMEKQAMRTLNILGNKFFSVAFSWLLGQPLKDTLCGTKVISRQNWEKLSANRAYFGDFDPFGDFDLIFGAARMNLRIVEVPIRYRARTYGETNISRIRHGWLLLKMVFFAMSRIKFR
jgi:SAM-dependent methyltransferase